jgi:16S rRNA (uracil1498-N3)-methyltransferase
LRRRFYVDTFDGDTAALRGHAAYHLGLVLRARPGQVYELSDGNNVRLGRVERTGRDLIEFSLAEIVPSQKPRLTTRLLLSIVKFDRFEWALEKATELGITSVVPIAAERSEKTLVAAAAKRAERWQKILIESAQQARRLRPPTLHPLAHISESFPIAASDGVHGACPRVILSERPDAPPLRNVLSKFVRETTYAAGLAIGPEGGWTDQEFSLAAAGGFSEASLGGSILRTETAVVAALASLNLMFQ